MPIAINGSGTVTGVSVGGLPDGIVDTDMLAANAVTAAKASGSVKGITMVDEWRVTANFTPSQAATVSANWERNDTVFSQIGTGMTESSGVFTFPQTGIYQITVFFGGFDSGSSSYNGLQFRVSEDSGGSFTSRGASYPSTTAGPTNPHFNGIITAILDVTDASAFRVKLLVDKNGSPTYFGATTGNFTGIQFVRLGDT